MMTKRISRCLCMLMALLITAAAITVVGPAAAAETDDGFATVYTDDFEKYADATALRDVWTGYWNNIAELDTAGGNKRLKFPGKDGGSELTLDKAYTGIIDIDFDYEVRYSEKKGEMTVRILDNEGKHIRPIYWNEGYVKWSKDTGSWRNKLIDECASGSKYSVKIRVNTNNQTFSVTMRDKASNKVYSSYVNALSKTGWDVIKNVSSIRLEACGAGDGAAEYIDNLVVKVKKAGASVTLSEEDSFDSYGDDEFAYTTWFRESANPEASGLADDSGTTLVSADGRGKALKVALTGGNYDSIEHYLPRKATNSDRLRLEFDFMSEYPQNSDGSWAYFDSDLSFKSSAKSRLHVLKCTNGGVVTGGRRMSDCVSGRWYHADIALKYSDNIYDVKITDLSTGKKYKKYGISGGETLPAMSDIALIENLFSSAQASGTDKGAFYIDNYSMQEYVQTDEEIEDMACVLNDDFESYASTEEMQNVWVNDWHAENKFELRNAESRGNVLVVLNKDGQNESDDYYVRTEFNPMTGKVRYAMKLMLDDGDNTWPDFKSFILLGDRVENANINFPLIHCEDGKIYTGTWNNEQDRYLMDAKTKQWYDIDVKYDITNKKYDIWIGEVGGTNSKSLTNVDGLGTLNSISRIYIQNTVSNGKSGDVYCDDVKLSYADENIDVRAADVTFVTADGKEAKLMGGKLPSAVSEIKIDFGSAMDANTITPETLVLENVSDSTAVSYNGALDANKTVYTMSLPTLLQGDKTYKLTLKKGLTNIIGKKPTSEKSFTFTTEAGVFELNINGISVGENKNPSPADIIAAASAKVNLSVINSTEEDKPLVIIVAYYDDNMLTSIVYKPMQLTKKEYSNKTFDEEITLPSGKTADKIKVFAWDSISGMSAYTDVKRIPSE